MHPVRERKEDEPAELKRPEWPAARAALPSPIVDDEDAVRAYWKAWELALRSVRAPAPGSGFVHPYMFVEFNDCIFAHDTAFMTMFGTYGARVFDAMGSLDNFYARQHETGEICREIHSANGRDYWVNTGGDPLRVRLEQKPDGLGYWWTRPTVKTHPPSCCTIDGLNDPSCFAWAEMEHYRQHGDLERLSRVLPPLREWYEAFQVYVRDTNGFYITDWASADNSPRNIHLGYGVEIACQMAHFARLLARMCAATGVDGADGYRADASTLSELVNRHMFDEASGFYYDLDREGRRIPIRTIFGFWPLLAEVADARQTARLARHLEDPRTFKRPVRVPSLSAAEEGYTPAGSYYLGGVWPFTNQMVIRGLETAGREELAREIALDYLHTSVEVFRRTGTVWEYLSSEEPAPGKAIDPSNPGEGARPDFAGWGALSPIKHLLEYGVGLRADAPSRTLYWRIPSTSACGCERYAFGAVTADLFVETRRNEEDEPVVRATANQPFTLVLQWGSRGERRRVRRVEP